MELSDFKGGMALDAVDFTIVEAKDDCGDVCEVRVFSFRLDGVTYSAVEDPSDGYRSCMGSLVVQESLLMENTFPPTVVECQYVGPDGENESDILKLVDRVTGEVILIVGTKDLDDYYPLFISYFNPKGMAINN